MPNGPVIFVVVLIVAVAGFLVGRVWSRQRFLHGRVALTLQEILSDAPDGINKLLAEEVIQVTSRSYGVPIELLRINDRMSSLTALDSWQLGRGQDQLDRWLRMKGIESLPCRPQTILELIEIVQRAQ